MKTDNNKVNDDKESMPKYMRFVLGASAGMSAVMVVHPMDLAKTNLQVSGMKDMKELYPRAIQTMRELFRYENIVVYYKTLSASLFRQATYTATNIGVYQSLNDMYKSKGENVPTAKDSAIMGLMAGACAAFVGTPADVILIRIALDSKLPDDRKRHYTSVPNALYRISQEEGIKGLWTGGVATVFRAMVTSMCQLASYSQFKRYFQADSDLMEHKPLVYVKAGTLSGILTAFISMPLDMAKTRMQIMTITKGTVREYSGAVDVIRQVAQQSGVLAVWRGFLPYLLRCVPQTVLMFFFLEEYNKLYYEYVLKSEKKPCW